MEEGCAPFTFTNSEIIQLELIKNRPFYYDPNINIHITATVTEYGTDKIELATSKIQASLKPYATEFSTPGYLLPGLPYHGALLFANVQTQLVGEVVEICYTLSIKSSWNYFSDGEQCTNFTLKTGEKSVQFTVPPLKHHVVMVNLRAKSINQDIWAHGSVTRLFSPTSTYVILDREGVEQCQTMQRFSVQFTTDKLKEHENVNFYYFVCIL